MPSCPFCKVKITSSSDMGMKHMMSASNMAVMYCKKCDAVLGFSEK